MDVRSVDNRVARWGEAALKRFNDRHPWSHNDHFHGWILRRLPQQRRTAIDLGCGRGELVARLAGTFDQVVGIDADDRMRTVAAECCSGLPNVRISAGSLDAHDGHVDLVTMIATLHHLDTSETFQRVRGLLAPRGRLLVVGLALPTSRRDIAWDAISIMTNPLIGLVKHPRAARKPTNPAPFPAKDPTVAYDEIRAIAAAVLPGARMRRRIGFRYTLEWTKPR